MKCRGRLGKVRVTQCDITAGRGVQMRRKRMGVGRGCSHSRGKEEFKPKVVERGEGNGEGEKTQNVVFCD